MEGFLAKEQPPLISVFDILILTLKKEEAVSKNQRAISRS